MRRLVGALCLGGLLCSVGYASGEAAEIEGVRFADTYVDEGVALSLHCTGLLRHKIVFKGYVAALYLGSGVRRDDVLSDVPKRLEISYFWHIAGHHFGRAGEEVLGRNVGTSTLALLAPRLERIGALYEDVRPGDRYALTYVPGRGTELALNGRRLGVIEGPDFAAAYFSIWLGADPLDRPLRKQLLECS